MGVSPPVRALDTPSKSLPQVPCPALPFVSAAQLQQCIAPTRHPPENLSSTPPAGLGLALDSLESQLRS